MPVRTRLTVPVALAAAGLVLTSLTAAGASGAPDESDRVSVDQLAKSKYATKVKVMTRNVFLGADLGPGLAAPDTDGLIRGAGQILNQVDANDFRKRADALAHEITYRKPDLIGLQEVAKWRTAPCDSPYFPPQAKHVRYDFLKILLRKLNADGRTYKLVRAQKQFDFEVPANTTGDPEPNHCDINGRLTMRDVILARTDGRKIELRNRQGGTFNHLFKVRPGGLINFPVKRGWLSVDAKVGKSPRFRFVATHLEAFDDETQKPSIRARQARELVRKKGPIGSSKLPVVLVGDLNSDVRTEVKPGDGQAYRALLDAGLRSRAVRKPMSCCLHLDLLGPDAKRADNKQRDHVVDHIMTDATKRILRFRGAVTGKKPYQGWWGSDHAGVVTQLLMLK
ncbi:endonuclease/exonuclease/phosphatase family protein [Nocardioidaceae bacterium SCSIO 66511]|nr:endonuclease/exonuclease/phosphatase family protein [Nocardioidaceae bacterium SCSIO 66511]